MKLLIALLLLIPSLSWGKMISLEQYRIENPNFTDSDLFYVSSRCGAFFNMISALIVTDEKQKKILNAISEVLITFSGIVIKKDYKDYTKEQMDSVIFETITMFEQAYASDMSENYINTGKQMTDELEYEYQICNSVYQDIAESYQ
jgi:hypothetical protein